MKQSVAVLKMTVTDFFSLEPLEVLELIQTRREYNASKEEMEHRLMYIAVRNAIGASFAKNYKYIDVYDKSNDIPKEYTEEQAKEIKDDLMSFARQ